MLDPNFLYLVKNLRGILYFSKEDQPELDWLKKKFRYRELGVSETLAPSTKWKKLVTLPKLKDDPVLDSLLLASRFLSPLIVLKESSLKDFGKGVVCELKSEQDLSDREMKLTSGSSITRLPIFTPSSIELAKKGEFGVRKELAEKDLKRFWRMKPSRKGRTVVGYVEPLLFEELKNEPLSLIPFFVLELRESEIQK